MPFFIAKHCLYTFLSSVTSLLYSSLRLTFSCSIIRNIRKSGPSQSKTSPDFRTSTAYQYVSHGQHTNDDYPRYIGLGACFWKCILYIDTSVSFVQENILVLWQKLIDCTGEPKNKFYDGVMQAKSSTLTSIGQVMHTWRHNIDCSCSHKLVFLAFATEMDRL